MTTSNTLRAFLTACLLIIDISLISATHSNDQYQTRLIPRESLMVKRSLCNTFGACGAKRSILMQPSSVYEKMDAFADDNRRPAINSDDSLQQALTSSTMNTSGPQNSNGKLVDEILDYVMEHLKSTENYNGKPINKLICPSVGLPNNQQSRAELDSRPGNRLSIQSYGSRRGETAHIGADATNDY